MCHRNIKITSLSISAVLGVAICCLLGCSEHESNYFRSYSEAKESGILDRGWIPKFIPKSAYDIKEQHKVDVAYIDVEFKFDSGDVDAFEGSCLLQEANIYICENSGYPVKIVISGENHAVIKSFRDGT
jgi:hypothetical protein